MASKKKHRCPHDRLVARADAALAKRRTPPFGIAPRIEDELDVQAELRELRERVADLEERFQPIERVHSMRTP